MKAVRIEEFGGPDKVVLQDVPVPSPQPGEVLVRVYAAAVNPVDWMVRERIYNPPGMDHTPLTLGQDFSGVIVELGPGAETSFRIGDEVFGETWGSFAEYVTAPAKDLVLKPRDLDFVVAAAIPMPSLTAWQMVMDVARARADLRFLIHGAAGGVGSYATQFARMKGANVIATASPPSFEWLRKIGANEIIDYQRERFEERVHDVDVVIDPIGGDVQARSWQTLKRGGLLINLIGEIDEAAAARVGARAVAFEMRYVPDELREIVGLIERGIILPHISQVLSLDEARKALDLNQQGQSHGQIVLKVA
jgi:NADPH:quinone reductase-like Zn-dependent oxidoreductase